MGSIRQWHWISASLCMAGMFLFSITGITLNHAADIASTPQRISIEGEVPNTLLQKWVSKETSTSHLPSALNQWLKQVHDIEIYKRAVGEWEDGEFYLPLARPGGDAWLAIDTESGEFIYEDTDRGWIAFFNDLHKGRDTGSAWAWFIDVFAGGCVIFSITGLVLLWRQTSSRQSTGPLAALGVLIPLVLILLFVH
ncbi:MAG: PepSY-associated TM helix domain-containing protein [Paraglaciecola sp.]|uniref:PepSY-associated TM helix domain-containing protein n=1 Tax=Paraglaciecola sp. TaxID=1920173 RepID=UPI003265E88E